MLNFALMLTFLFLFLSTLNPLTVNSVHVYSEVSPLVFSGSYFHESGHRIAFQMVETWKNVKTMSLLRQKKPVVGAMRNVRFNVLHFVFSFQSLKSYSEKCYEFFKTLTICLESILIWKWNQLPFNSPVVWIYGLYGNTAVLRSAGNVAYFQWMEGDPDT